MLCKRNALQITQSAVRALVRMDGTSNQSLHPHCSQLKSNQTDTSRCCPSSNVCAWSNSAVVCCPSGQSCNSYSGGGGAGGYQQTTSVWQQPTTTWQQATSTYYPPATTTWQASGVVVPAGATTVYTQPYTTQQYYGGYCSTQTMVGLSGPTTGTGQCGTILIVPPNEAIRKSLGWMKLGIMVMGLQALGALVFAGR
jgi:hypothetical protein